MGKVQSISAFNAVKRKWMASTIAADVLIAISFSWVIASACYFFIGWPLIYMLPFSIVMIGVTIFVDKTWKISDEDVARYFDENFHEVEESSRLLLKPTGTLNYLQLLQVQKISTLIKDVENPGTVNRKLFVSFGCVVVALLFSGGVSFLSVKVDINPSKEKNKTAVVGFTGPAIISDVNVTILSPAYTRKKPRIETGLNIVALEGSTIKWNLVTSKDADSLTLTLNDRKLYAFTVLNGDSSKWELTIPVLKSGYYQLNVDGQLSDLYLLQTTSDGLPKIVVLSPKPDLLIKYGEEKNFVLQTDVTDDYGVKDAYILATVSSGSGEAVQFNQKKLLFRNSFKTQSSVYNLKQNILTDSLAMRPGDELYFIVMALDNNNQQTRSDMHRVILEDTSQLFSVDGLISGLDIKPEYFRSQRQIIIETEQLLRDQKKLSKEEFENKSNSLGIDQKLLRLRYGKFLGEEDVTYGQSVGESHEGENHDIETDNSSSSKNVLQDFGHSHDNAEDATYFDAATKKQLRATLNEMWKAELQLRTLKPKAALPFELEALRLLKDLQQKSRVYVAKTSSKTTPLKPETRLTGELYEIINPVFTYDNLYRPSNAEPLHAALTVLSQLKQSGSYNSLTVAVLSEAQKTLGTKAIEEPSKYLAALNALRELITSLKDNKPFASRDIIIAEQGLNALIPTPLPAPTMKARDGNNLSDLYFIELEKRHNCWRSSMSLQG